MSETKEYKIDWDENICCVLTIPNDMPFKAICGMVDELDTKPPFIILRNDIEV